MKITYRLIMEIIRQQIEIQENELIYASKHVYRKKDGYIPIEVISNHLQSLYENLSEEIDKITEN